MVNEVGAMAVTGAGKYKVKTDTEEKCQMQCEDRFRAGGADYRALRRNHIAYHDQAQMVKE